MASDKITRKDILDDKVLDIGKDYAKSLEPAIVANMEWLKTFAPIKEAALAYGSIEKEFRPSAGRKEFLELKAKEVDLQKKTAQALKAEQDALLKLESVEKKRLDVKAKEIDIANKQLTLTRKEEQALERKTKLSTQERVELQQRNKNARQLALISSSLSTAYERESARLVLLTRRYKGVAIEQGKSSKEARKLQKEVEALRNKLFEVDKAAGNFQRNVGNYPRAFGGAVKSIRDLASAAGLLGGAFLAVQVARDAARTIIEFDRQLIAVRKTTNLTKQETASFSKEVVNLGLNLKGISIQGLLKSSEIAGQLGIRGSENILKFSTTLEQLKLTSDIVGDEAARNFAKFIEVSSDSVENADRLGSVITELGNNFATTESQILSNTTEIQKGISIYNTTAQSVIGLGAATNALGNEAEASRGALQTTFKILNDGASTGKNLDKILKLTGQTAAEFRKEFATNSVETFRRFVKGLSDSQKEGENLSNTLTSLGITEKRATTVVGSLAVNYETLEDALNRANNEYENNQALTNEADQAAESLEANISDLSDSWDALVLSVESGDGSLSKGFKNVVGFLNDIIGGLRLLNLTTEEYNKNLENDVAAKTYKEYKQAIQESGDASQELAVQEADNARDRIDSIKEEIKLLQDRNQEVEGERSGFGKGFRRSASLLTFGAVSKENPEIKENEERIKELSVSLGFYNGVLKATEEAISFKDDALKENNETLGDATKKVEEQRKAEEKANRERERALQALLRRRQLEKDAAFSFEASDLNNQIKAQKEIIKNEEKTFEERFNALEEQAALEIVLARSTAEHKFDIAKNFSEQDIEALLEGGEVSKAALKKIGDEELQIISEYQAKIKEIKSNREDTEDSLEADRIVANAEREKAIKEKALNEELIAENDAFQKELAITDDKEAAIEAHERRVAEIKKKYALEGLNAQVAAIEALLQSEELSAKKREQFENELKALKLQISNITTDSFIEKEGEKVEAVKLSAEEILAISSDLANALNDLASAIFDARIQKIDEEIQANDDKYERILENENLTEEQRKGLQEAQERDREALEKKKRKEQRKQAVLDKATAALSISLNTAAAIVKFLADPGGLLGLGLSISAGVIGAIQLAAALAAPIPKYAKGTEDHPGGWAEVGEGKKQGKYVPEIVKEPGKKPYLVDKPTMLNLPRHTKVVPTTSLEDYEALMRASILSSVDIDNKKLNSFQAKVSVNNNYDVLVREMQLTREAIKNQKKAPIHFHERKIDVEHAVWAAQNRRWHG